VNGRVSSSYFIHFFPIHPFLDVHKIGFSTIRYWRNCYFIILSNEIFSEWLDRFLRFGLRDFGWLWFMLLGVALLFMLYLMEFYVLWARVLWTHQLTIDPNGKFLDVHPLVKIIVNHIGNDPSYTLIIMLFN
jgi:hypothetical protein